MGRSPELPSSPEWPIEEARNEYDTGWYTGGFDQVTQPDGTSKRYYWAELDTAVVIVPVVDDQVVFVEQYRPTVRHKQLELPAGIIERGESYSQAARRELREETGFLADGVSVLQELWVATGVLRHQRAVVFAEGLTPTEADPDENEFLRVRTVPIGDAIERVRAGPTNDATLNGLLLAREEGVL